MKIQRYVNLWEVRSSQDYIGTSRKVRASLHDTVSKIKQNKPDKCRINA
jgi:hypothetical protein